jgi:hypothetical protein
VAVSLVLLYQIEIINQQIFLQDTNSYAEFARNLNPRETIFTEATHVRFRVPAAVYTGY